MDKELIDHIAKQLQQHEEQYVPGAWERFSEKKDKRSRFVLWPMWVAAALLLLVGGTFLVFNNQNHQGDLAVIKPKKIEQKRVEDNHVPKTQEPNTTPKSHLNTPLANNTQTQNRAIEVTRLTVNPIEEAVPANTTPIIKSIRNTLANSLSSITLSSSSNRKFEIKGENKQEKTFKKPTFEDLLAQDSKVSALKGTTKAPINSKWEPGIYVAPAMGNDNKVNMNYGFSLSYNVADKLSISSGIAYSSLSSTSNPSTQIGAASDAVASSVPNSSPINSYSSNSRSLESVNASVRGINIPLELKYNISKKFYTGVGVSALAILNNKQDNNYLVSTGRNITVANTAGIAEQKMLIVTERVSETQAQSLQVTDKYIGFYNFSLGYKQKISKKTDFAIEPFLRLPMKTFSNDNLNLTNGGLRLKIDF
ncbi:hypothetical protein OQZ33_20345 [Pedobacter sp. MC2016-05]|uniref:hypothetical protein n=1 Tax=Pedobacter sp. MC2016-05 TaxID=2994474 RepID=UPI0022484D97|nr:hypothetical protein [Pedobacter sp. MC2016-05]MCX2476695.1 hypothetical protein [Pedobacter sp. MC2016-05]